MMKKRVDKKQQKHDKCLDDLIHRLAIRPGFLCPNHFYNRIDDSSQTGGEMDLYKITKNSSGVFYHRYYEVKGRDSEEAYERALTQFRHALEHHPTKTFKFIYVTPEKIKRVYENEL